MAEKKKRVGFSIDFKGTKEELNTLVKALKKVKKGLNNTGKEGEASLNRITLGMKSVFQNITTLSTNLRKGITSGQKMSQKQLKETLGQAKNLESRLNRIHSKTAKKFEQAEGRKRSALKATLKAQQKATKSVERVGEATAKSLKKQADGYKFLASVVIAKVGVSFRGLIKEATILAARNEVLGTAMRTVGNNAGISTAELERTEMIVRKLGISINDTREVISRFAQAQLSMENATRLSRAAQDLAAGSTLGSSEALRIMTQSILSLLPRQLRQFGVVVNLNQVYREQSRILNKSIDDLTSLEQRQGLLNKIFQEAAKRAGAYERSMKDAGKILTTLSSRIIPDTLSMFGDQLLPVFTDLVFAVKDLLEWLQNLSPGWKKVISAFAVGLTVILSIKTALIALGGIMGFVSGGFAGAAKGAVSFGAALGYATIAVGLLTAAVTLLADETVTAQEKMSKATEEALNVEVIRIKALEDLQKVLQDTALTEEDVGKIIRANVGRNKELIPLLNKEGVTREQVLAVVMKQVEAQQALVDSKLKERKLAAEANIERLKDEQYVINELIKMKKDFIKISEETSYHFVPGILTKRLDEFTESLSGSQKELRNLDKFIKSALILDFKSLHNELVATDAGLKKIALGLKEQFGIAAKKTTQSANDMQQALLGLDKSIERLQKKALKKFPFLALAKEQVDEIKKVDDALKAGLVTEEEANKRRLKFGEIFKNRRNALELKAQEQLASIGATALQKIEAKRVREVELAQGSAIKIKSIETQAATARNAVYEKMWEDRLTVVKESTDVIAESIRARRELAIEDAAREANLFIAQERTTTDTRIQARQDFYNKAEALLSISQGDELAARQQHNEAVGESIQELYNTGVINEEQFNERLKALSQELKSFQQQQITERITFLKSALSEMLSEETKITENIRNLNQEQIKEARGTEDALRTIRQEGQTDYENRIDERKRATKLLAEGERALYEGNFARVKEISEQVKNLALANSKEVVDSASGSNKVLISADDARKKSIESVKAAGELLRRSFVAQREAEVIALETVKEKIDAIQASLKNLLESKKQIEISVKDEATSQIASIQSKLDNLKDKTITVTVYTRNIAVGGGATAGTTEGGAEAAAGGPVAGAEGDAGFAKGAVDIKGPGSSFSDSIVAFLSNGESVINAAATKMFAPLLEVMNADPAKAKKFLTPGATGGAGGGQVSETNTIGDVNITLNGVDSKDVKGMDWRKVVREQIGPELKRLKSRRTSI